MGIGWQSSVGSSAGEEASKVLKWKTKGRAPRRERTAGKLHNAQGKEPRAGRLNQDPRRPTRGCGRVKEGWKARDGLHLGRDGGRRQGGVQASHLRNNHRPSAPGRPEITATLPWLTEAQDSHKGCGERSPGPNLPDPDEYSWL